MDESCLWVTNGQITSDSIFIEYPYLSILNVHHLVITLLRQRYSGRAARY